MSVLRCEKCNRHIDTDKVSECAEMFDECGLFLRPTRDLLPHVKSLALAACAERDQLHTALGWFLDDERFQVAVGGNPKAVETMLADARAIYAKAKVSP